MRLRTVGCVAIAMSLGFSSFASATVVFQDDFEGSGYNNGDNVGSHSPDVGTWTTTLSSTIRDGSDPGYVAPAGAGGTYYASMQDRIVGQLDSLGIAATTGVKVYTEFDYYVPTTAGYYLDVITFAPSPGYRGPDFILKSDGTLANYTNISNQYNTVANFSFTAGVWQHASLVVDYGTGAASLTVGASTGNFTVADPSSTSVRELYFLASDLTNKVYVDNIVMSTTPVPEPAALSLIGLGAVGLLNRRRKA